MKTSEKLYNINREISIRYIALKKKPHKDSMIQINHAIGECIKEVREMEVKNLNSFFMKFIN